MRDITGVLPFNLILFNPAVLKFLRIKLPLPYIREDFYRQEHLILMWFPLIANCLS